MAQLVLNVSDANEDEVFEAFWNQYGAGVKPDTRTAKMQFVKQCMVRHIKEVVRSYRTALAERQARQSLPADPDIT